MLALLDTSVLISGHARLESGYELGVASLSYAELQFGASLPDLSAEQRASRRTRILRLEDRFGPGIPFDDRAAASYGIISEAEVRAHRQVRRRIMDLLIASIAHSNDAALITENGADFAPLSPLLRVLTPDGRAW